MSDEFDDGFDEFGVRVVRLGPSPAKIQDSLEELERDVAEIRESMENLKGVVAGCVQSIYVIAGGLRDHKASGHHGSWPWVIAALIAAAVWFFSR